MRSKQVALTVIGVGLALAPPAAASVIGTFSSARPGIDYRGDLFGGIYMTQARAATLGDGHTLVNMDAGITREILSRVDSVYLPTTDTESFDPIVTSEEARLLCEFAEHGGKLIVQGDSGLYRGPRYNSVAEEFGVRYLSAPGRIHGSGLRLDGELQELTTGPYGVSSVVPASHMATLEIGTSSGRVILDYQDKVSLYAMNPETGWAGLGTVVFLGDVNHFEDILGWTSHAPILWRNMMSMPSVPFCYVDCDSDGEVTFFDFLCFQDRFASGHPEADCDVDGVLTFFDFLCYQDVFAAGCG